MGLKEDATFNLAMVYFKMAEPKKLMKTLKSYLKMRPNDVEAKQFYETLRKVLR